MPHFIKASRFANLSPSSFFKGVCSGCCQRAPVHHQASLSRQPRANNSLPPLQSRVTLEDLCYLYFSPSERLFSAPKHVIYFFFFSRVTSKMQFGFAYTAVKNGNGLGADFNLDLKQDETVQKRICKHTKRNTVSLFL